MLKNRMLWLIGALALTPIAFCFLSGAAVYAQKQQAYRQDVDDLLTIAAAVGYMPEQYIGSYRAFGGNTPDLLRIVYYTDESWEQFTSRVQALGFAQQFYFHDSPSDNPEFLEWIVNRYLPGKTITLNDHYTSEDFISRNWPEPIVTVWKLRDAQGRDIEIYYAQTPGPADVWKRNGEVIPGNIVLVSLDREASFFNQMLPYPEPEVLIQAANTEQH